MQQLDRQRAAGAQPWVTQVTTVGDEPMIIDALLPATPNKHWIVSFASLKATLTLRGPSTAGGFPPNSGIFLCPPGTPSETLAQAQGGIVLAARPILLPLGAPGANVATVGAAFAFAMQTDASFKFPVPYQWFVRVIVSCLQGTATPGPGVGSVGIFTLLATLEDDKDKVSTSLPECD